jgi:DNA mismatch repair ATPase MutS
MFSFFTKLGEKRLRKLLVSPYADPKKLNKSYNLLETFIKNSDISSLLQGTLSKLATVEDSYT